MGLPSAPSSSSDAARTLFCPQTTMSTPARPQPGRPPAPQQQQIRPQQQTYRPQLAGQQPIRPQTPTYRPIPPPGQYAASSSSVSRPQTPVYRPPLQGTPTNGYRPQQQQGTYQRPPFNQQTPNQAQQQQQQQQFYRPKPRVVPEKDVQPGPFASSRPSLLVPFPLIDITQLTGVNVE